MAASETTLEADIIVIGAGPGGLAAALAIQAAGLSSVLVFDKASSFRNVGSGFGLQQNGRSALHAISPAALERVLSKCNADFIETRMCFMDGSEMGARPRAEGDLVLTAWYEVQRALLESHPEGVVHTGHAFKSYAEDADGVTVTFENGVRARCRLLVGADGAMSPVRKQCLDDAPAEYCGLTSCRAILPTIPEWWPYKDSLVVYNGQVFVMPIGDGKLSWFAQRPLSKEALADVMRPPRNQAATKEALLQYFGEYTDPVVRMLRETPPEAILEHGIFGRQAMGQLPRWGVGRVTLLGDAAHAVHPLLGQGTSMAFEDAVELGYSLSELGPTADALRSYEERRMERCQSLVDVTHTFIGIQLNNVKQLGRFNYPKPGQGPAPAAQAPPAAATAAPAVSPPSGSTPARPPMMQQVASLSTHQFAPVRPARVHAAVQARARPVLAALPAAAAPRRLSPGALGRPGGVRLL